MLTHPIPNMTTPCIGVMLEVLIQSKELGISRANAVTATTTIVMLAAMNDDILYSCFINQIVTFLHTQGRIDFLSASVCLVHIQANLCYILLLCIRTNSIIH